MKYNYIFFNCIVILLYHSNRESKVNYMQIRKYKSADKTRLQYICKQTAWDNYKNNAKKLESVVIMFNDYFTENEPENIFVLADADDTAVGYIICSSNYEKFIKLNYTEYSKRILKSCPSQIFFFKMYLHNFKKIKNRPVHFHIDILPQYQRQGWGTKLLEELCKHLKNNDINHLSGCCINKNSVGYKMYIKYGFKEIYHYTKNIVSISIDL